MKAIFGSAAHRDVHRILEYYMREADADVAFDFQAELSTIIDRIKQFPKAFPLIHNELRRAILKRFPFQILYRIESENTIRILAIRHHSRRPDLVLTGS